MGLSGALRRVAAAAPPSVFAVAGLGMRAAVQDLRLDRRVRLVATPREANVLLVAGRLTESLLVAAIAAHDVLSAPRGTLEWRPDGLGTAPTIPGSLVTGEPDDPVPSILALHQRLLTSGWPASAPPVRVDAEPAPWQGVGPYGQGGSGMTGGVPYGRPMAEREDDRDGLTLDALPLQIGPLFSGFPDGLTARVTFTGDLVHRFELGENPFLGRAPADGGGPFVRALSEPVRVAELEVARARELLRWTADALRVHGLHALSLRVLELAAHTGPQDAARVGRLRRWLTRAAVTGRQTRDIGLLTNQHLDGLGAGPVARAAGLPDDARATDPVYQELGFTIVSAGGGDARSRWRQRLAEAEQALELAGRAGERCVGGTGVVESPRGRLEPADSPSQRLLDLVPGLVIGLEWGDAITVLTSLDLDLREAAAAGAGTRQPTP